MFNTLSKGCKPLKLTSAKIQNQQTYRFHQRPLDEGGIKNRPLRLNFDRYKCGHPTLA